MSAALYATEYLWQEVILTSLNAAIRFHLLTGVKNEDGTIPSGTIVMPTADNHNARGRFYELKNEIGTGSSDPTIQESLSYRKAWVSDEVHYVP